MHEDPTRWATGRLLSTAARKVERRWDAFLEPYSLSHASVPVLALLAAGDLSQRELAAAMDVTEQTVSRMLVRLERTGYIGRATDPSDRRRHVVALTGTGRDVLVRISAPDAVEALATDGLTAEEVAGLRAGLLALLGR